MINTRTLGVVTLLGLAFVAVSSQAQLQILYQFSGTADDAGRPSAPGVIAQGRDGNFYSTTLFGGSANCGTIFKLTQAGSLTVMWSFPCAHPAHPLSGLTLGTDGNFYGAASDFCYGSLSDLCTSNYGNGSVFKISPSGTSPTTLHSFDNNDGAYPEAPPVQATDGNFYGTTLQGGVSNLGTVYKITPSGGFTSLYSFDGTHGASPSAPLLLASDGNLYGTTESGGSGTCGCGTVFKITTKGKLTTLYSFDGILAENPGSALIQANNGSFYGTTIGNTSATSCANGACGTLYNITSQGKFSVVHSFSTADGTYFPVAGVVLANDGNFYGVTSRAAFNLGIFYRITPAGAFTGLGVLGANSDPEVTPIQHTNGILYGEDDAGGEYENGEFYSVNESLKSFAGLVPSVGKVGKTVGILGHGFKSTTAVSFNGVGAKYTIKSSTFLEATVPTGATTGKVTVTRSSGKLVSKQKFEVTQ
ncbi:MAG: choice-of-anchor tandem repeat GloVer-containing protein [Terriglobales bacterium]